VFIFDKVFDVFNHDFHNHFYLWNIIFKVKDLCDQNHMFKVINKNSLHHPKLTYGGYERAKISYSNNFIWSKLLCVLVLSLGTKSDQVNEVHQIVDFIWDSHFIFILALLVNLKEIVEAKFAKYVCISAPRSQNMNCLIVCIHNLRYDCVLIVLHYHILVFDKSSESQVDSFWIVKWYLGAISHNFLNDCSVIFIQKSLIFF